VKREEAVTRPRRAWSWEWPAPDYVARIAAQAMGTFWFALMVWALMNGPRLHAEAEREVEAAIEEENQSACERLGMPTGSEMYAACASELNGVRRQHEERLNRKVDLL